MDNSLPLKAAVLQADEKPQTDESGQLDNVQEEQRSTKEVEHNHESANPAFANCSVNPHAALPLARMGTRSVRTLTTYLQWRSALQLSVNACIGLVSLLINAISCARCKPFGQASTSHPCRRYILPGSKISSSAPFWESSNFQFILLLLFI